MNPDMAKEKVKEALHKVAPEVDFAKLNVMTALREQADIDSYDFYNFLVQLEQSTQVRIPETKIREMKCLSDLIQYLAGTDAGKKR